MTVTDPAGNPFTVIDGSAHYRRLSLEGASAPPMPCETWRIARGAGVADWPPHHFLNRMRNLMSYSPRYRGPRRRAGIEPEDVAAHADGYWNILNNIVARARLAARRSRSEFQRADAPYLLNWISDERMLHVAWDRLRQNSGPAPGPDGIRFDDVSEAHLWPALRELRESIRDGTYRPGPDRPVEIAKSSGGTRTLLIQNVFDRTVARSAAEVIQPFIEPRFDDWSFGFRPRRGTLDALAVALDLAMSQCRPVWVQVDIRDAFGSVPLERLRQIVQWTLHDESVSTFVDTIMRSRRTPGLRQGNSLSPFLLNLYLDKLLDRPWRKNMPDVPLIRYADDILLLCQSVGEAESAYDRISRLVTSIGLDVKTGRADSLVLDTPERPARWLGYCIQRDEDWRILIDESAFSGLSDSLDDCHRGRNAVLRARDAIRGWIDAYGPCYQWSDPWDTWRRASEIAITRGFDEIPGSDEFASTWQRAHARWTGRLKHVREQREQSEAEAVQHLANP